MKNEIALFFENGLPKGTAQEKGERIAYRVINGRRVPYIQHYKKSQVSAMRREFELRLKTFAPKRPSDKPIKLMVVLFFDIKAPKKAWGTYKTTRPDCDNYVKEIKDAMTSVGFWYDDAQVADLRVIKRYAECGEIYIRVEELET